MGRISIAVAAVAAALGMSVGGAAPAGAAPGDHLYIALGDSVSYGVGAETTADAFAGRLYADFRVSRGADALDKEARRGATAGYGRANQLPRSLAVINETSDTVAVTVGFGANEAVDSNCIGRWDSCQFRGHLSVILAKLTEALAADPGDEFFAVLAYFNSKIGTPAERSFDTILRGDNHVVGCGDTGADVGLNDLIFQEAGDYGVPVANSIRPMREAGEAAIADDRIHPNNLGHGILAQAFLDSVPRCPPTPNWEPEDLYVSSFRCQNPTITAVPGQLTIGTSHRDVIVGTPGPDRIRAGGGDDLVCAGKRGDVVSGGEGRDTVSGGPGWDDLRGERGGDSLFGQSGPDRLLGGPGSDGLFGGAARDRLQGGWGRNRLVQ